MTRRPFKLAVVTAQVALVAGLVAYAAHTLTGGGREGAFFEDWLYNGLLAGAALVCLARGAFVRADRAAWLVLGAGLASWSAGVLDATLHPDAQPSGFPSRTDLLWLGFYPAAYAALILLVRSRVRELRVTLWLDGIVGALALAALTATLAFPSLVDAGGDGTDVLANLTYPVADIVLGAFALWVCALTQWRPGRMLGLVVAALLAGAFVDVFSLWAAVSGHETAVLDWLWPASAVLLAVAGWRRTTAEAPVDLGGLRPLAPPVLFAASSLGVIVYSRSHAVDTTGFVLAVASLAAVTGRMAVTFAENLRLLAATREETLTDPLTGLGNRRRLLADLEAALEADEPRGLVVFDLDGFKAYNDAFGHPAGDALLTRLGDRLRATVDDDGAVYRLGGDEFCALVSLDGRVLDSVAEQAAAALDERGPGSHVTTSLGAVRLPAEATTVSAALQLADERLYSHKAIRRRRAGDEQQALDVLKQLLGESGAAGRPIDPDTVRALCAELLAARSTPLRKAA